MPGGIQSNEVRTGAAASASAICTGLQTLIALIGITMKDISAEQGLSSPAFESAEHALSMLQGLQMSIAPSKAESQSQPSKEHL